MILLTGNNETQIYKPVFSLNLPELNNYFSPNRAPGSSSENNIVHKISGASA